MDPFLGVGGFRTRTKLGKAVDLVKPSSTRGPTPIALPTPTSRLPCVGKGERTTVLGKVAKLGKLGKAAKLDKPVELGRSREDSGSRQGSEASETR